MTVGGCEILSKHNDVARPEFEVSMGAKIRNRYNHVPHLTKDTNSPFPHLKSPQKYKFFRSTR